MKYKRGETFRYEFEKNFKCSFKIISIGGVKHESRLSVGELIDLSPNGLKLFSSLDIPLEKQIVLYVEFTLNNKPIKLQAEIVWKRNVGNGFHYGLKHESTLQESQQLIEQLKIYVKNNMK